MANKTICALTYGDTHVFTLPYGTCSSNAASVAKTVAVQDGKFSLEAGARVLVKFTNTNTALNPTLNVSSTGAKAIYCKGSAIKPDQLAAKGIYEFVYDGTYWEMVGNADAMPKAQVEDMIRDVSNYNFIKNWNMENPINTKGQDSYTGGQYTIDGWYATNNVNSVVINKDNYITITNTQPSTYMWFRQYLDCGYLPYGTYTLSVLVESCGDCSVYFCNDEGNAVGGNVYALDPGLNTFTQTIDTSTCSRIQFVIGYNASLSLKGVKIERGSLQTLAIQRPDGTWELKTDGWDKEIENIKSSGLDSNIGDILLTVATPNDKFLACEGLLYDKHTYPEITSLMRPNLPIDYYDLTENLGTVRNLLGLSSDLNGSVTFTKELYINSKTYLGIAIYYYPGYKSSFYLFDGSNFYNVYTSADSQVGINDACVYKNNLYLMEGPLGSSYKRAYKIIQWQSNLGSITSSAAYAVVSQTSTTYYNKGGVTSHFVESDNHLNIIFPMITAGTSNTINIGIFYYNGTTWTCHTSNISAVYNSTNYNGACALGYDKITKKFYLLSSKYYSTGKASFCIEYNTTQSSLFTVLNQWTYDYSTTTREGIRFFIPYNNTFYWSAGDRGSNVYKCPASYSSSSGSLSTISTCRSGYDIKENLIYLYRTTDMSILNITNGSISTTPITIPTSFTDTTNLGIDANLQIMNLNNASYYIDGYSFTSSLYKGTKIIGPTMASPFEPFKYYVKIKL